VKEIDPSAFDREDWPLVKFDRPAPLLATKEFLCSADRRILLKTFPAVADDEKRVFVVPSYIETIADRCFEDCCGFTTVVFDTPSNLKRVGDRAFLGAQLTSFTIPESIEEITGASFVGCRLGAIEIEPGNRKFIVEGDLLLTSDGCELVRYFGRELEVVVPSKVDVLGPSCFEECDEVEGIHFENGSQLRRISRCALTNCSSLRSISIPASVEMIE
jgi:hypothetical protein